MGVEAAMGQADLFHDLGDARAVVPSSPSSARGGRDDPFVRDCLAAWGGPPGGGSAHMMSIIYPSGAERKTAEARRHSSRYRASSCPSWARTRTLLIQSRAQRVCLEDTMSVSGCPPSIGARRLGGQCPDWAGETLVKRL